MTFEISEQITFDISLERCHKKLRCVRVRVVNSIHAKVVPALDRCEAKKTLSALLEDTVV